ncbi:MAG: hypothetical protein DRI81_12540, partial [Chloroflexi bacterium]
MKRWRGQGLVEFALLIPVLLLVILGIVETALVIQGIITVQHAARTAARFAVSYRPLQGACQDQDRDGHIADGIGTDDDTDDYPAPYPICPNNSSPPDYVTPSNPNLAESDSAYYARRAALIKRAARDAATGLRIDDSYLDDFTLADWENKVSYTQEPGFFGVVVRGFESFTGNAIENSPGIEGMPVQVVVVHNVPILDPFYQAISPYVMVSGDTQMINEGVQVGVSDMEMPYFDTNPIWGEPDATPENTPISTPGTPEATPTLEPSAYSIELDIEEATNTLPDERGHDFIATVTDQSGNPISGVWVNFYTDRGGFGYSGVEPRDIEVQTDAQGQALVTLYGNEPGTASLQAWLDYNGDDTLDDIEPHDTATKTWIVTGPYIVVSEHEVIPLDYVYVDVMDHDPISNSHRLLWCVLTGTETSAVVQDPVNVDSVTGDAANIGFEIPVGSYGSYQIESHWNGGDCGATDLVAHSGAISVTIVPPDLNITSISWPAEYGDELPGGVDIPFTIVVSNSSAAPVVNTYFDIDYYLDPNFPPPFQGQLGIEKQWLLDIDAYDTQMITATFNLAGGEHQLWGQVDTTNYIEETDEDNNISGPYTLTVACTADSTPYGDRFDDGSVAGKWTSTGVPSSVSGNVSETSAGYLRINAYGSSTWGSSDNMYYVYQSISGDFDARLRVISGPSNRSYSKAGLMVRNSTATNSRYVALMRTHCCGLQFAYRETDGGDAATSTGYVSMSPPMWVRIVRSGDTFDYYYSAQEDPGESDWTYRTSEVVDMDDSVLVGIAHASYSSSSAGDSELDEFVICQASGAGSDDTIKPPGLVECEQILSRGDFEGNPATVFAHWHAGDANAYQHQSTYFYDGSMSMRLHDSMGSYPNCPALSPHLEQTVEIPGGIYTMTTMVVGGQRLVAGSLAPCSFPDTAEADDVLHLQMKDDGGGNLGSSNTVANGGAPVGSWASFEVDVTDEVDLYNNAGENVEIYFYGTHDADYNDTWFYLDSLECDVCTEWPVPEDQAGTASIGGDVRVLIGGIPQSMQGVEVWAYAQGGEVYHTATIHDGTYHFYNVPPGIYHIYAEVWVSGSQRSTMTTVTV